jgi:type I restriction enzyme S subunit
MSSEWSTLEEVADVIDSLHKTPTYSECGLPMVRGTDVKYGELNLTQTFNVDKDTFSEFSRRYKPAFNDIIITRVGSYGITARVTKTEFCLGQNTSAIVPTEINPRYLYSALNSSLIWSQIESGVVGSTQKTLSLKVIKALKIPRHGENSETEIATILGTLDDRITLLRETNATLEAIAQALFKSWFVDFDPVHAKAQGRQPEGMDEQTAALFPDRFVESELGMVPLGWEVGTLSEYANLHKSSKNPLHYTGIEFEHYSLPAFDSGQMPILEMADEIKSNKTIIPSDAVLLSKLNPHIPRVWMPIDSGKNAVCSTEFLVFTPVGSASSEFIYCSFTTPMFHHLLCQLVTGTSNSHQRVKAEGVQGTPSLIPSPETLDKFTEMTKPIFKRIGHNRNKIQTLSNLRDTLLPRLISGQLRLPDVEA